MNGNSTSKGGRIVCARAAFDVAHFFFLFFLLLCMMTSWQDRSRIFWLGSKHHGYLFPLVFDLHAVAFGYESVRVGGLVMAVVWEREEYARGGYHWIHCSSNKALQWFACLPTLVELSAWSYILLSIFLGGFACSESLGFASCLFLVKALIFRRHAGRVSGPYALRMGWVWRG